MQEELWAELLLDLNCEAHRRAGRLEGLTVLGVGRDPGLTGAFAEARGIVAVERDRELRLSGCRRATLALTDRPMLAIDWNAVGADAPRSSPIL
jgi:hypothetical protein